MSEDRLRSLLKEAVPQAPAIEFTPVPRRVLPAVLVGVLVLLVVLPLSIWLRRDEELRPAIPPLPTPARFSCGPYVDVDTNATSLPEGAVAVGLCNVPGGRDFQLPAEPLVRGVPALVDYVNRLRDRPPSWGCRGDLGIDYRLVFTYRDGSRFFVDGADGGCRDVWVGRRRADGGPALWKRVVAELRAQRGTFQLGSPERSVVPSCRAVAGRRFATSPVAVHRDVVAVRLCQAPWAGLPARDVLLDPDEASALFTGLTRLTGAERRAWTTGLCGPAPVPRSVVAVTVRGEFIVLRPGCRGLLHSTAGGDWKPSRAVFDLLGRHLYR